MVIVDNEQPLIMHLVTAYVVDKEEEGVNRWPIVAAAVKMPISAAPRGEYAT